MPSAFTNTIGILIIFSAFSYNPDWIRLLKLPSMTLSIILYKLTAITGINKIQFDFICFLISNHSGRTHFTHFNAFGHKTIWDNQYRKSHNKNINIQVFSFLHDNNIAITDKILILAFRIDVHLNCSRPKKSQLISNNADAT